MALRRSVGESKGGSPFAKSPQERLGRVQVAMLGPLEVRDGAGVAREVSGTRLRALPVLLASRAGQVMPAGTLIDELRGERLPADAANALQALVSRLRRAVADRAHFGPGPSWLRVLSDRWLTPTA